MKLYFTLPLYLWNVQLEAWKTMHIKGFFGMMGVHELVNQKRQTILEAFMKDGILQGVFIDEDEKGQQILVPIFEPVATQKHQWFRIPMNVFTVLVGSILQILSNNKINLLGAANTALLQDTRDRTYALFERDLPYELIINHDNYTVSTGPRKHIPGIRTFSGHSKKRCTHNQTQVVDSIEYDIAKQTLTHNVLSGDLQTLLSKNPYKSRYFPIVHDFYMLDDEICWVDSPFTLHRNKKQQYLWDIPMGLNRDLPTIFHVGNQSFVLDPPGIAIFHIALIIPSQESYDMYASVYENLHFADDIQNLSGTFCLIRLDRKSGKVTMIQNPDLEPFNLDFPVLYEEDKVILRNIDDETKRVNGFVICNDQLDIVQQMFLRDFSILGECVVIRDGEIPYVLFFTEEISTRQNHLMKWNLQNDMVEKMAMNTAFHSGFHSLFIVRKLK